jgi:hypothetical protein
MLRSFALSLLLLAAAVVRGQDNDVVILSPFVVSTASESIPPITLRKTADFLLLQVQITNDTRDEAKRRDEIYQTVKGIISDAAKVPALEITTREMVLTLQNYQVRLEESSSKADTSSVELLFRLPLKPADDVGALTTQLRQFSKRAVVTGRTEVFPGEIGISVRTPERFRYELIGQIAQDVKKLKELFGDSFDLLVKGLDQRLKWRRASVSELELYLPYSYEVLPSKTLPFVMHESN